MYFYIVKQYIVCYVADYIKILHHVFCFIAVSLAVCLALSLAIYFLYKYRVVYFRLYKNNPKPYKQKQLSVLTSSII